MSSHDKIEIDFESLDQCIDLKNKLIAFIKRNKRQIKDKGLDPELKFTYTKIKTNE
jgi:hypothetical protein